MIIDVLDNMERYINAVPNLKKVLEIISRTDFHTIPDGQYTTDNPNVRYNVFSYATDVMFSEKAEFHNKEIDVQILVDGNEKMDLSPVCIGRELVPYSEEKEAGFVQNIGIVSYMATSGFFALFFPGEPHATSLRLEKPSNVKKVVFKLLV